MVAGVRDSHEQAEPSELFLFAHCQSGWGRAFDRQSFEVRLTLAEQICHVNVSASAVNHIGRLQQLFLHGSGIQVILLNHLSHLFRLLILVRIFGGTLCIENLTALLEGHCPQGPHLYGGPPLHILDFLVNELLRVRLVVICVALRVEEGQSQFDCRG